MLENLGSAATVLEETEGFLKLIFDSHRGRLVVLRS